MISLAMDTAGTVCAACLYDSATGRVLAQISEEVGRGHAERLMGIVSDVLEKAKVSYNDIGKVITTVGPGSFTGVRVGVATARGFGVGLGIPVVGVTSLETILAQTRETGKLPGDAELGVVLEAGRRQVYCQFSFKTSLAEADFPFVAEKTGLIEELSQIKHRLVLCGSAAREVAVELDNVPMIIDGQELPRIEIVAHIGAGREMGEGRPEPLYLRKPDAKPQSGFAVERS